jgi:prepilin-type N-terminal cleavage/methylation domain-containing protein/prepilin-type processing-associated H-X9-DG protein
MFSPPSRRGFTLFELLVALALLVVLFGLALPGAQRAGEFANRLKCQNNLKQLDLATIICSDTNASTLPPSVGAYPNADSDGTLFFHILPYLEQDNVYKNAEDGKGNHSAWNNNTYSMKIPTYFCPSDGSGGEQHLYDGWLATTSYGANFLVFGLGGTKYPAGISDGTSNTIFFAERYQVCNQTPCAWAYGAETEWAPIFAYSSVAKFQEQPRQAQCNPALPQAVHSGGINVGMGDGSVRFVHNEVSLQTWYCALTPAGNDILGSDF